MRSKYRANFMVLLALIMIFILDLSACPAQSEPISVELRPSKLVIFNNTTDTINFAVMERRFANYTHWIPCSHPKLCGNRGIKPGLSKDVPYRLITNWYPRAEVVVYWWRLVADPTADDGYRVDGPYETVTPTPSSASLASE